MVFCYNGKTFDHHVVEEFPKRHVKEILAADVDSSGYPDLFAVLEAEMTRVSGEQQIVDTPYGTKLIKEFFSESMKNDQGEDVSTREIKKILETVAV